MFVRLPNGHNAYILASVKADLVQVAPSVSRDVRRLARLRAAEMDMSLSDYFTYLIVKDAKESTSEVTQSVVSVNTR